MPCGIDLIHPEFQEELYNKILEKNGLVISELEGKYPPARWTYVKRNRIVAGLSKAILIVEAGLDSGTLITADLAQKYKRKLFAVPGQINSEVSKGAIKLIKEGAEVATEPGDILRYYFPSHRPRKNPQKPISDFKNLSQDEQKIIEQLRRESMEADTIARSLGVSAAKIGATLSLMQLKGFINQESGKYYVD